MTPAGIGVEVESESSPVFLPRENNEVLGAGAELKALLPLLEEEGDNKEGMADLGDEDDAAAAAGSFTSCFFSSETPAPLPY